MFTILEVDSAVVRSQSSAAPAYPLDLLTKKIEGSVNARYVVDTTGFADTTSFEVLERRTRIHRAVRDALPYMRFSPAKIGTRKCGSSSSSRSRSRSRRAHRDEQAPKP